MNGEKHLTIPQRNARIIAMRGLGCSIADIASTLGLSASTVNRVIKKYPAPKGELIEEAMAKAQDEVLSTLVGTKSLQLLAATTARNTLLLKEKLDAGMLAAAEQLMSDPAKGLLMARGLNALANCSKLSNDSLRSAIRLVPPEDLESEELPELVIQLITDEELEAIRKEHAVYEDNSSIENDFEDPLEIELREEYKDIVGQFE